MRTIALFPGSFKPPHAGHLIGLAALLERPDVCEVVIIISQRARPVPGTSLVLDAAAALEAFAALVGSDQSRVRFEIAEGTAVNHALAYLDSVKPDTELLFCVGAEDFTNGDSRFSAIAERAGSRGIRASTYVLPTRDCRSRATDLRHALGRGAAGREIYLANLPDALSNASKQAAWLACYRGLRDKRDYTRGRLEPLIAKYALDPNVLVRAVDVAGESIFEAYRVTGRRVELRTALDEIDRGMEPPAERPRYRYAVAKRALRLLSGAGPTAVELPILVGYDRDTRTLITEPPLTSGTPLASMLDRGIEISSALATIGRWLGWLHSLTPPPEPLRGTAERDRAWWLKKRCEHFGEESPPDAASAPQPRRCVMHFGLTPDLIRVDRASVAVTQLETAGSFGDPALDLVIFGRAFADRGRLPTTKLVARLEPLIRAYLDHRGAEFCGVVERARRWLELDARRLP